MFLSCLYTNSRYDIYGYISQKSQTTSIYNKSKKTKKKVKKEEYQGDSTIVYQNPKEINISGSDTNNLIYILSLIHIYNLYLRFHYVCELCEKCSFHLSNYKKSNDYRMKKWLI